jgi:hypothetical protein
MSPGGFERQSGHLFELVAPLGQGSLLLRGERTGGCVERLNRVRVKPRDARLEPPVDSERRDMVVTLAPSGGGRHVSTDTPGGTGRMRSGHGPDQWDRPSGCDDFVNLGQDDEDADCRETRREGEGDHEPPGDKNT